MVGSYPGMMNGTNAGLRLALGDIRARGPKALADSLADHLRQAIRDGRLSAGTLLPASRSLAMDVEASRGVVVRAYEQLTAEGYLRAHTGRGTVVGDVHTTEGTTPPSVERFAPANPGLPALGRFPRRAWLRAMEQALTELPTPISATAIRAATHGCGRRWPPIWAGRARWSRRPIRSWSPVVSRRRSAWSPKRWSAMTCGPSVSRTPGRSAWSTPYAPAAPRSVRCRSTSTG